MVLRSANRVAEHARSTKLQRNCRKLAESLQRNPRFLPKQETNEDI